MDVMKGSEAEIDLHKKFVDLKSHLANKGNLLDNHQDLLFKLIDSIDKIPVEDLPFDIVGIMKLEIFKEIIKQLDDEFEDPQKEFDDIRNNLDFR